jgi:hypothetical protein
MTRLYISTRNWFIEAWEPELRRHDTKRYVKNKNRDVEKKKDMNPNRETAAKPCDKTGGSGERVAESGDSVILTTATMQRRRRNRKKEGFQVEALSR